MGKFLADVLVAGGRDTWLIKLTIKEKTLGLDYLAKQKIGVYALQWGEAKIIESVSVSLGKLVKEGSEIAIFINIFLLIIQALKFLLAN